jgi:hypothetical protein
MHTPIFPYLENFIMFLMSIEYIFNNIIKKIVFGGWAGNIFDDVRVYFLLEPLDFKLTVYIILLCDLCKWFKLSNFK